MRLVATPWPSLPGAPELMASHAIPSLIFFAAAGGVLWLLAVLLVAPAAGPGPLTSIGALALAWAAGFVTPGAAAGVGVREAVLMVALDGSLGPEASAVVALAFRLITTAGDGVFCALALTLPLPSRATTAPVSK